MSLTVWRDKLLSKKNLTQIYIAGPRFWTNTFNTSVLAIVLVFLVVFSVLDLDYPKGLGASGFAIGETVRMWAAQGFTLTMTIVAFLIAGFTVLATITKPALFVELAQVLHRDDDGKETGLTELEYIFFAFINVFVHYLAFLLLSTFLVLFGTPNGPLAMVSFGLRSVLAPKSFALLFHVLFVAMGTWFISLILRLKSFIWNVYQVVLIVIVADQQESTKGK
jgi:hypothetical protein